MIRLINGYDFTLTMQVSRLLIENNPEWERAEDDKNPDIIKWNKKGTNIYATCNAMDTTCTIIYPRNDSLLPNLLQRTKSMDPNIKIVDELRRYTTSLYTNPTLNGLKRKTVNMGFDFFNQ